MAPGNGGRVLSTEFPASEDQGRIGFPRAAALPPFHASPGPCDRESGPAALGYLDTDAADGDSLLVRTLIAALPEYAG